MKAQSLIQRITFCVLVGALFLLNPVSLFAQEPTPPPIAIAVATEAGVAWQVQVDYAYTRAILTVAGPGNLNLTLEFGPGEMPRFQFDGARLPDGNYTYELSLVPQLSPAAQAAFDAAAESHDPAVADALRASGELPSGPLSLAGTFSVTDGVVLVPEPVASSREEVGMSDRDGGITPRDQVIPDDSIVQGSQCVGFDCVNNENFSFDTIRLKENNLRIKFDDTSSTGSFPSNDWQITINDSSSGGASYFSVDDITGGKVPFKIEAGAPSNSLYVDSTKRIGIGTSTPVLDLHVTNGNTPGLRLEQTGSSGFTPQTWDVSGNEANFFIRDVTNGSKLSFRIRPGAPESSIDIASDGDIGMGTTSPAAPLHIRRTNGTAQLLVEEASSTTTFRTLALFKNNGPVFLKLQSTTDISNTTLIGSVGAVFRVVYDKNGALSIPLNVDSSGNMTLQGTLTTSGSCSSGCRARSAASNDQILAQLSNVPMVEWINTETRVTDEQAAGESVSVARLSPDFAAFHLAYGLGKDDTSIAPLDVASVALASAQALNEQMKAQQAEIDALKAENATLTERLTALEARIEELAAQAHSHSYLPNVSGGQ